MEKYMLVALEEAKKSLKTNDVPVGAVVVQNGKIIGKGHNQKEWKNNATKHAEIIAIERACRHLKSWRLNKCTLYTTLEPCMMCCGAIIQSRIEKIVYATINPKFGYVESVGKILSNEKNNHRVIIDKGICEEEATKLLKNFFEEKRK